MEELANADRHESETARAATPKPNNFCTVDGILEESASEPDEECIELSFDESTGELVAGKNTNENTNGSLRHLFVGTDGKTILGELPEEAAPEIGFESESGLTNEISEIHKLALRARARRRAEERRKTERFAAHPWPFLQECVNTEDPHDKARAVKPYPAYLPYLEDLVDEWYTHKLFLVPKSRRMHVSWTFICLHVWLFLFHPHEYIFFAARKLGKDESEGSLELVKRAKFVINNLRGFVPPATGQHRGRIICPSNSSQIVAVAQGSSQLRQVTATALFADEFAFWEWARETYTAAKPTIEQHGRFTGISSAYPGFFESLVYDKTN